MITRIIKIVSIFLFIGVISSCSSYKYEKRDYWLKHQYRSLSYVDTSKLDIKVTSFIIDGAVAKQKGNFSMAVVNYMLALKYDSTPAILFAISDCFYWMAEYDLSIEYAYIALKKDPNFVPCYEILCRSYLYLNDLKNATIAMECAVKINENEESLVYLASMYEYQNLYELAKNTYQKLIDKYKNSTAAEKIVNIERINNNYENAGNILYDVWRNKPDDFKITMELINNWFAENKIDSIINNIDKFDNTFEVDDLETMYNYIIVRLDTIKVENNEYNKIISKIDNRFNFSQILIFNAGNYAVKNNDTATAKKFFDKIINNPDALTDILLRCVNTYYHNGFHNIAKNTLSECMQLYPHKWEYPYWRAVLEEYEKNNDSTIKYLLAAQKIDNESNKEKPVIQIDNMLANLYFLTKNYRLSDSIYEIIIDQHADPITYNNYAYSLSIRDMNLDKALELSKKSLEFNPNSPEYLDTHGWIHFKLGNYTQALNYIEKSLSFDNKNCEVYLHLADIYLVLENNTNALKIIENAIKLEPNNPDLILKKQEIENMIQLKN